MGTESIVTNPKVDEVLHRLLASRELSRSNQLKKILAFVCEASVAGRQADVTESTIAEVVLNRRDFDPNADTIVRVQMRRLREKLEDYYANEGAEDPVRIEFQKHSYVPVFRADWRQESKWRSYLRWPQGFWYGFVAATALASVLLAIVTRSAPRHAKQPYIPHEVLRSPFWNGFAGRANRPLIAISTPLFFRSADGFMRHSRLNFAEDLPFQKELLPKGFTWPLWDSWMNIRNIQAALHVSQVLAALHSEPAIESARHVSLDKLRGRATLFLGHPRGTAALVDLLTPLNFHVDKSSPGQSLDGFSNRSPRTNELSHYQRSAGETLHNLNLSGSDYGLITLIRDDQGSHILSLFGDYCDTPYFLAQRLTDSDFVRWLQAAVFGPSTPSFRYCQVVIRVRYLNSQPLDAAYTTHRLIGRDGAELRTQSITSREIHSFLLPGAHIGAQVSTEFQAFPLSRAAP